MASKNTSNFEFLKNKKPDLYRLCFKMEKDLLITPVSMLAYSTRFLEYVLYDIAKSKGYKVNKESGFVNNVYELIQLGYIDYPFGDLLIKAYVFRNNSIHNTNIDAALKNDKKTALELNKRLFDIADNYYGNINHKYNEPEFSKKINKEAVHIKKQEKMFDNCIICGKACSTSKSNFCSECEKILDYREVISQYIVKNSKESFFRLSDFDYSFKNQMIKDLLDENIIEKTGNSYHFISDALDDYFKLTDSFMQIDEFLLNFFNGNISNYRDDKIYKNKDYPFKQVQSILIDFYVGEIIGYLKNGFSLEYSLQYVDITKQELNVWYDNKKSEFIDGNKDDLFIEFNELLIMNYFKSIEKNDADNITYGDVNFWSQYFDDKLGENKLKSAIFMLKRGYQKQDILNKLNMSQNDLNKYLSNHKELTDEYHSEINKRKDNLLKYVNDLSLNEALKKSKLTFEDIETDRNQYLNGYENEYYQKLSEILMKRYLDERKNGLSSDEITSQLAIEKSEINQWINDELFIDFQNEYMEVRLELFKKAISEGKNKAEISKDLEISEEIFDDYIERGKQGQEKYIEFYEIYQSDYFSNMIRMFLKEFGDNLTLNQALTKYNLSKNDLKNLDGELYEEFIEIKINKIASTFINKGKINNNLLKKLDLSKKEYNELKDDVDEKIIEKQIILLTDYIFEGMITSDACKKVHCDLDEFFDWILKGSLGDDMFSELASAYWEENIFFVNDANSDLRDKVTEKAVRNNFKPKVRKDFDIWKKWGLIGKKHIELTEEDVKNILKRFKE